MSAPLAAKLDVAVLPNDAVVPVRIEAKSALVAVAFVVTIEVPVIAAKAAVPVKVGDALKTKLPVPVSSVNSAASSADVSMDVLDTLLLNTVQSEDESFPFAVREANGRLNVCVSPDAVIVKSVPVVEVARVSAPV